MEQKVGDFESRFDIDKVSFKNVSDEFERKFRDNYRDSLKMMSDSRNRLDNASAASSLGALEKMAQNIEKYDKKSDFETSYHEVFKEFQPFTES